MICAYRKCNIEFEPTQTGGREQKFCCTNHGRNERQLIYYEKNRKPLVKRECEYRLCHVVFETRKDEKRFCKTKHQKAEQKLIEQELQSARDFRNRRVSARQKQKAREFAVLNCLQYSECNKGITMNCHKCQEKVIEIGAWMREPGALHHHQDDYHSVCLPSNGRSE